MEEPVQSAEDHLYNKIWAEKIRREPDLSVDGDLRVSAAHAMLDGGGRFLDLGCGEGTLASFIRGRYAEIHGIDISEDAVQLARKQGVDARKVNINVEPLPYPDGYFDAVASLDVIEHVFDPIRFVQEIHRVLAAGGITVISTPNIRKIQRIGTLISGTFPRTSYDPVGFDGGHLHYFTSRDLRTLLTDRGFTVVATDGICGDRRTWKYRLVVALLGSGFEKEFLSSAIIVKARKG